MTFAHSGIDATEFVIEISGRQWLVVISSATMLRSFSQLWRPDFLTRFLSLLNCAVSRKSRGFVRWTQSACKLVRVARPFFASAIAAKVCALGLGISMGKHPFSTTLRMNSRMAVLTSRPEAFNIVRKTGVQLQGSGIPRNLCFERGVWQRL